MCPQQCVLVYQGLKIDFVPGGGTTVNWGQVCAAKGVKHWPFSRMKQVKIYNVVKAQTWKIDILFKGKQKLLINGVNGKLYFISVTLEVKHQA